MKLLHVSDPHFGTERAPVLEALVELVREQRPELLLLTGDITQRARRAEFEAARHFFFERLRVPRVLAIPGNHDISLHDLAARLFWPYAGFRRAFGAALEPEFESEALLVLALNTTRPWRHVAGELSRSQIERVAQRVARAPAAQLRLVLVHQPLAVVRAQDAGDVLHGAETALRRWAEAGVDAVLGGHLHLPYVLRVSEPPRPMWVLQAGTALSHRRLPEAGNSVHLMHTAAPRRLSVERWDFDETRGRFAASAVHALRPA